MKTIYSFTFLFCVISVYAQESLHNCTKTVTLQGSRETIDTQVLSSRPNNNYNYSVSNTVYSWSDNGPNASKYALINFVYPSDLGYSSNICQAKLSLYYNPTDPYETFHTHSGTDNGFIISRIVDSWTASTVTWNTKPNITSTNELTLAAPTSNTQNYPDIDVKNLIMDMFSSSPIKPYGFQLRMTNPNQYRSVIFASSTNSNSSLHPKLVIQYSPSPIIGLKNNIGISPNPAKSLINITNTSIDFKNSIQLLIYSNEGKLILKKEITSENNLRNIDVSSLVKGIYSVKLFESSALISESKFIKK